MSLARPPFSPESFHPASIQWGVVGRQEQRSQFPHLGYYRRHKDFFVQRVSDAEQGPVSGILNEQFEHLEASDINTPPHFVLDFFDAPGEQDLAGSYLFTGHITETWGRSPLEKPENRYYALQCLTRYLRTAEVGRKFFVIGLGNLVWGGRRADVTDRPHRLYLDARRLPAIATREPHFTPDTEPTPFIDTVSALRDTVDATKNELPGRERRLRRAHNQLLADLTEILRPY